jgi:transcription antitermination factor NusG
MLGTLAMAQQTTVSEACWHVAFGTKPDRHMLDGLKKHGYEHYYPQIREMEITPKRELTARQRSNPFPIMRSVLKPLFPRYVFIRFSLRDGRWHTLFELLGIEGMLCEGYATRHIPVPIDNREIDKLLAKEIDGAIPSHVTIKDIGFAVGETVRIKNGAMAGHNGTVEKLPDVPIEALDESMRVGLLVTMFGGTVPAELQLGDLEKI